MIEMEFRYNVIIFIYERNGFREKGYIQRDGIFYTPFHKL